MQHQFFFFFTQNAYTGGRKGKKKKQERFSPNNLLFLAIKMSKINAKKYGR